MTVNAEREAPAQGWSRAGARGGREGDLTLDIRMFEGVERRGVEPRSAACKAASFPLAYHPVILSYSPTPFLPTGGGSVKADTRSRFSLRGRCP